MPIIFLVCARPEVGINMKIMVPEANIHSLAYFNIEFNYRAMMSGVLSPILYIQSVDEYSTLTNFVMYKVMT